MLYDPAARILQVNIENPRRPMRRCEHCALNLDPGKTLRALGTCPLFGFSRYGAELRCPRFEAKS